MESVMKFKTTVSSAYSERSRESLCQTDAFSMVFLNKTFSFTSIIKVTPSLLYPSISSSNPKLKYNPAFSFSGSLSTYGMYFLSCLVGKAFKALFVIFPHPQTPSSVILYLTRFLLLYKTLLVCQFP